MKHIDLLNTFLIVLALALAYVFPFELFLIVYAVLGPLHYLTEINWIRDKNYFIKSRLWVYLVILLACFIALPSILKFESLKALFAQNTYLYSGIIVLQNYSNGLIFIVIMLAIILLFIKKKKMKIIAIVLTVIIALLLNSVSSYHIWIGIFLPTIIHVFVFTLLFMWYGNLKSKNKIGCFNVILLALVPIIITLIHVDFNNFNFSDNTKSLITDNRFYILNTNISKLLGLTDGSSFFFNDVIDIKIQIMIAFAYTYHYLNWFSKTAIIGWHKKLTTKKSILILLLWIVSVAIYFYDYKLGLAVLLTMSLIHVFLEFPLNILSIQGIYRHYFNKS